MSRKDKLLARLKSRPKDFTWNELKALLKLLGYRKMKPGKSGGSRKRFIHESAQVISLHEPHPQNTLKRYVVNEILEILKKEGIIDE